MKKNEIPTFSNTTYKNKLKMCKTSKCKIRYCKIHSGKQMQNTDINVSKIFLNLSLRVMVIKAKSNKWDLIKFKTFLQSKGNQKKNKNSTFGLGAYKICKWCYLSGINFQNKQTVYTASYQNKQPNQKLGRRSKQIFLQRRQTDDQ